MDETGTLGGARDPFFAVGLLKCTEPFELLRPMQRIRDKRHFYDEIKWNKVSQKKLPVLKELVDVFVRSDAHFSAFICDKRQYDVIGRFKGPFLAYEALARQLVQGNVSRGEYMWLVADEYSTPDHINFEGGVRDWVNKRCQVPAVAGVCRMRSHGVDLLQMIDLLLGAVVYEYKANAGIVGLQVYKPKAALLEHTKKGLGVTSFLGGYRDNRLNIAEYGK
jgi:hypothetical protein